MEKTVFFRTFEEEDIDAIYQWKNDDELNKQTVGLNRKVCRDDVAKWVRSKMPHNPYEVYWAICAINTGEIIGYMYLTDIHYINSSANYGGLVIGNRNYHDGMAWIEANLFVYEYAFERLGLNRVYGSSLMTHDTTHTMGAVMFSKREGIMRQAAYKNGQFYDVYIGALLREEYFEHKRNGEYEVSAVLKRLMTIIREGKKKV